MDPCCGVIHCMAFEEKYGGTTDSPYEELREPCAVNNHLKNVHFGDLHAHTSLSFESWIWEVRSQPEDASFLCFSDAGFGPRITLSFGLESPVARNVVASRRMP